MSQQPDNSEREQQNTRRSARERKRKVHYEEQPTTINPPTSQTTSKRKHKGWITYDESLVENSTEEHIKLFPEDTHRDQDDRKMDGMIFKATGERCIMEIRKLSEKQKEALRKELAGLEDYDTYVEVNRPKDTPVLRTLQLLKEKRDGRTKGRIVVGGDKQTPDTYFNTWAPTPKDRTIRIVLSIAASGKYKIHQADFSQAYLNSILKATVYCEIPPIARNRYNRGKVWKLKKGLYGLKQAAALWNETLTEALEEIGLTRSRSDECLFYDLTEGKQILLLVYVDDILLIYTSEGILKIFLRKLRSRFKLKNIDKTDDFLGYNIKKSKDGILVTQSKYFEELLEEYGYKDCNPVHIPATENPKGQKSPKLGQYKMNKIAGSIGWATKARPDLCYAFSKLAQGIKDSNEESYLRAARVLRYIKGTMGHGLWFPANTDSKDPPIVTYVDATWGHEANETGENCKSRSGFIVYLYGGPVYWGSKKQTVVALSSTEAEIYAELKE